MRWSIKNEMTRSLVLVASVILALSISGCLIAYDLDDVELEDTDDCEPDERSLRLIRPVDGQTIQPNRDNEYILDVSVAICGVTLVENWGQPHEEGEGYLRVRIDEHLAHRENEGIAASNFGIMLPDQIATPGAHTMLIEVRNNDNTDAGFPARQVTFNVAGETQ